MKREEKERFKHIEEISLLGTAPKVFSDEPLKDSEIWRRDITLRKGKTYQVEASSGGGKSSLCSYIYGARTDYDGIIKFDGIDVSSLGIETWQRLRRDNLAYLPQELMLFPELSALENIRMKNDIGARYDIQRIEKWMIELGIYERRDFPVGKMSVGQQQRVAIIRALCQDFDFLLLDEPVSHLDEENNRKAAVMIAGVAGEKGAGIISTSVGNPLMLESCERIRL